MAAKIVLDKKKYDSSTRCLEELHWIPIKYRIEIKVLTLVFKHLCNQLHSYLREIENEIRKQGLRSSNNTRQLKIPWTARKPFWTRSFSIAGPTLWNRLPNQLRRIDNYMTFKKQLHFSVPQGSIQGAFLFISYASTLDQIVTNLTLNGFADDHSIRKESKPSTLGKDELKPLKSWNFLC